MFDATPSAPELATRYMAVRAATDALAESLSPEDATPQSMPEASPAKWHLAHTTWFFETFVLAEAVPGYRPFDPDYRYLFNSYYNGIGAQYPRPQRGLITRPGLEEVRAYRQHVDAQIRDWLGGLTGSDPVQSAVEIGLHHEQQHQELLLTDLKHLFSYNPHDPVYCRLELQEGRAVPVKWLAFEGGIVEIGASETGFAFDNERPLHQALLRPFQIANRPVTAGEYLEFMDDGGYRRPELWLADGWTTVQEQGWQAPLYWAQDTDGHWHHYTLGGRRLVDPDDPLVHVSYYEADAFARWAGARLPSEVEWEIAARRLPVAGNLLEQGQFHPRPVEAEADGMLQAFGDVWEWTTSPYQGYPGFQANPGALGEYNGKFMCNQMVLRGGSCVTPASHIRPTYRNFFPPDARWQFAGVRLARDA
jgi:ergothioneine biosynthesis protein EgtB